MHQKGYQKWSRQRASEFTAKGHKDSLDLRELLILTTNKISEPTVSEYFQSHHDDQELLQSLIDIALEAEDAGDAPWAAANIVADFPATMLAVHRADLETISQFEWSYLSTPARVALGQIDSIGT